MKIELLLQKLFFPLQNCEAATLKLCKSLDVPVTKTTLQKQLEEHPDYPSLLAISDVLKNIGVDSIGVKTTAERFKKFSLPLIAQIRMGSEKYFTVVSEWETDSVTFFHPLEKKIDKIAFESFSAIFTGYILLTKAEENAGEKEYPKHQQEEKRLWFTKIAAALIIPVFTIVAGAICFFNNGTHAVASIIYTLLTLVGTITGVLLLWYEVDKHNPALQQICTGGKKTNCNAILNSDAAKIFGIGWSAIGFTYFAGTLISLLVSGIYNLPVLSVLAWLNVLALPYIVFSLYYQSKVAKQWCVLCLTVQVVLGLQFITSLAGKFLSIDNIKSIQLSTTLTIIICFVIPFLIVSLLLPALRSAKENKQSKNELQRLKHNPQIFEALLAKQKAITEPTEGLGIVLGNPNAKYKLIKVCNPYCGPCAKAHPAIEDLLENNADVQVQIIFSATDNEKDFKAPPVKHLLAIAEKNNEIQTKQALDDWYLAEKKDYEAFAVKYPMNGELQQQSEKLKAMSDWCNKTGIAFTPTFFVSLPSLSGGGAEVKLHRLPKQYTVSDLRYFLTI